VNTDLIFRCRYISRCAERIRTAEQGMAPVSCTIYWFVEDNMVAGDSKRIVVIKNISSNLIEEAILILKPGQETPAESGSGKQVQNKSKIRNDMLLKEAEFIINQYIKEHGLQKDRNRHLPPRRFSRFNISVNTAINIFLATAVVFLLFVIGKFIF
jgi:hypothetical protein